MNFKNLIFCFLFLSAFCLHAQNKNVITAWKYLKDYQEFREVESLEKAKTAIDTAVVNSETKGEAKAWMYRGKIYQSIFDNNFKIQNDKLAAETDAGKKALAAYQNTSVAELIIAFESYKKSNELDSKGEFKNEILPKQKECAIHFENKGIASYNSKAFDDALSNFERAFECNAALGKVDSTNANNAAIVAERIANWAKAKKYYEKLVEVKYGKANTYSSLVNVCYNMKDSVAAIDALKKGRAAYPNDVNLLVTETNYFLRIGKNKEASDNLNVAIQNDPKNHNLYLVLANIYDNLANPKDEKGEDAPKPENYLDLITKAETNYKKAIEVKPDFFDAIYNLGILYNNYGVSISKKADNIMDNAKFRAENEKADIEFKKAIPILEKALELNGKDKNTLLALKQLYLRTDQKDKMARIEQILYTNYPELKPVEEKPQPPKK